MALTAWSWFEFSKYQRLHAEQQIQISRDYAQESEQRAQVICRATKDRPLAYECTSERPEEARPDKATRYDLDAQQDMAEWAFLMFATSLAGVVVAVAGVFFVAATLLETSAFNEQVRVQFAADARAWIRVKPEVVTAELIAGRYWLQLVVNFRNIGKTPATNVIVHWETEAPRSFSKTDIDAWKLIIERSRAGPMGDAGETIFPDDDGVRGGRVQFAALAGDDLGGQIHIPIWVTYASAGIDGIRMTPFVLAVQYQRTPETEDLYAMRPEVITLHQGPHTLNLHPD